MWRLTFVLSAYHTCPPTPTSLTIGQFLPREFTEPSGMVQEWLLAYAHALQCVGKAAHRRLWHNNGDDFTPQVSLLVDTFLEEMNVQLVEADIIDCWDGPAGEVPWQRDTGCFMDVISHLNELAMHPLSRHTWDMLVFPAPLVGGGSRAPES